jgi:hypothetical protein
MADANFRVRPGGQGSTRAGGQGACREQDQGQHREDADQGAHAGFAGG